MNDEKQLPIKANKSKPMLIRKNGDWYYKFENGVVLEVWSKEAQELLKAGKK